MPSDPKKQHFEKSLSAGSGMAAPSQLVGGAALAPEHLDRKMKKTSKWLARAEQEYNLWAKKEEFRNFMQKRLPSLTRGEIDAIGQSLALGKSLKMEKVMSRLNSGYKDNNSASDIAQRSAMEKFDDAVMDAPMAQKEKSSKTLKKGK